MRISILTLFPQLFHDFLSTSILDRASDKGLVDYEVVNLRDFGEGSHKSVDDRPYGGGAGMILRADVLAKALKSVPNFPNAQVILTSASGRTYNQTQAVILSKLTHLIIICGHYEGVDQRFVDEYVDEEISIGDFVLTGGEIPALAIIDSVVRLIPGVLKKEEATQDESFSPKILGLVEYPHYTRPEIFERKRVPAVLLSGNHQKIREWRGKKSLEKTKRIRPDLLLKGV